MGRKIDIDKGQFIAMVSVFATKEQVCQFFHCSLEYINRWCNKTFKEEFGKRVSFIDVAQKYRVSTTTSIKQKQLKVALKKEDPKMLIHLGINYCGQTRDGEVGVSDQSKLEEIDPFTKSILESLNLDKTNKNNSNNINTNSNSNITEEEKELLELEKMDV